MRVFISSVRKGLEEERDALPGLIKAIGHTPVRFEDFSAQNIPSRQACLDGVNSADVYLLILGSQYGHRFPDTGQSPTHEEWTAATAAGKRRVVYRKSGVRFDDEQQELSRQISDYTTGVFHDTFTNTPELLTKVAAIVRELETQEDGLNFENISAVPDIKWRREFDARTSHNSSTPTLELHVLPIPTSTYSSRIMTTITESLVDRIRTSRIVDGSLALSLEISEDSARISISSGRPHSWGAPRPGEIVGLRLAKSRQVSIMATLPTDGMGPIIDAERLPEQVAHMLSSIGVLNLITSGRVVIAAGLDPIGMTTVDSFDDRRSRKTSTGFLMSDEPLHVTPDESISLTALDAGAAEVARHVSQNLINKFKMSR